MDIDEEFYYEPDNREEQQDLEEAHFYQTVSTFEELLVTHDPNLVVWSLSQASVDKLKKSIDEISVPF